MAVRPECLVSGALATVLRMSRFAGIAPLRFQKKGNNWRVCPSPRLALLGNVTITISGLLFLWRHIYQKLIDSPRASVLATWARMHHVVWTLEDFVVALLGCMAVYSAPAHMRSLIPCLNQMHKINSTLNIHHWGAQWTTKLLSLFVFWGAVGVAVIIVDYVVVTVYLDHARTWIKTLSCLYYVYYWVGHVRKMQYFLLVMHVRAGFAAVNERLRGLLREIKQKQGISDGNSFYKAKNPYKRVYNYNLKLDFTKMTSGRSWSRRPERELRRVALAYAAACDAVRHVERSHGPILLLLLGTLFYQIVVAYYYWIINLAVDGRAEQPAPRAPRTEEEDTLHVFYELVFVFWSFVHTFNLAIVIEPCHLTHMEMRQTRVLTSRAMQRARSPHDPLAAEMEIFYKYLVLNDVSYRPLKFTTVTRGLLFSILANVTTYLVVLIQVK